MAKRNGRRRSPPSESEFFEAVGRAVVAWQGVETIASTLFFVLLRAGNELGARSVFYRVSNFAMRVELLDIAAKYLFQFSERVGDLPERWEGLRSRLFSGSDLRNRLAHSELGEDEIGFKLRPPFFDFSRVDPNKLEKAMLARLGREVDYVTVKGAENLFEMLCHDIYRFRDDVARLKPKRTRKRQVRGG